MHLDLVIEDTRWADLDLSELSARGVGATLARLGCAPEQVEITVMGCDDARIAELNNAFRDKPGPTNILSWPAQQLVPPELPVADVFGAAGLGDIALGFDTCAREAAEQGKSLGDHVIHLIVHGTLHLFGYDHISDKDATIMEGLEIEILGKLGLPDPYSSD